MRKSIEKGFSWMLDQNMIEKQDEKDFKKNSKGKKKYGIKMKSEKLVSKLVDFNPSLLEGKKNDREKVK